jgi:hypothetical protein
MKKFLSLILVLSAVSSAIVSAQQFNALLFTRTDGWHHQSISVGVEAIKELGQRHVFGVDWQDSPRVFSEGNLDKYDVIIFLSTTGNILNDEQQAVMEKFIQKGGGFVGIHAASDTEYGWEWYTQLVGRMFEIHPLNQTTRVTVVDRNFPGTERMPDSFLWTDELYEFQDEAVGGLNYILTIDESYYNVQPPWGDRKTEGMGDFHPVSWYHNFDGGRSFYTALGHMSETFSDKLFMEHIFGGIYWAATGKGMGK